MFTDSASTPSRDEGTTTVTASPVPATLCEWCIAASRRVAAPIAEGFHHTDSLPERSAATACPSPTERAPTGSRRNSAPSWASPFCARAAWASVAQRANTLAMMTDRLERSRLIHEHDRDVVSYRIPESARMTHEARLVGLILELALALRADEDRKQLWGESHLAGS